MTRSDGLDWARDLLKMMIGAAAVLLGWAAVLVFDPPESIEALTAELNEAAALLEQCQTQGGQQ